MECSLCTISILLLMLVTLNPSCIGQPFDEGVQTRCLTTDRRGGDLVRPCRNYYASDSGYFNTTTNKDDIDEALRRINSRFQNEDNSDNPCTDLMLNYLCNYYFPSCNLMTDEVTPVCSTSCALLANNEDCVDLRENIVDVQLEDIGPPSDSCSQTYQVDDPPPTVTASCLAIEESLNESLPLTCTEIEAEQTCRPQIPNSHYAPATFEATDELFGEIQEIITQLDPFNPCRVFINTVICVFRFPACNPETGMILPICPELCPTVDDIVMQCSLEFFRGNPDFPNINQLLDTFVCLEPETYYNFPEQYIATDECTAFIPNATIMTDSSPTGSGSGDDNIGVIIGAVIAAIIVVSIIVILMIAVLCLRCNRQTKVKYGTRQDSHNEYAEPPSAVRYHAHDDDRLGLNLTYASNAPSPYLTPRSKTLNGGIGNDTLGRSRSSLQLMEVNHFLLSVKDRFSEVLLPVESITKQGLLGKGAFGVVHKGELKASDGALNTVAIKTIKSSSLDAMKDLVAESAIMKTFHHPNVLPLLGVCIDYDDEDMLKIVIPFMANGDLKTFLKDSRVSSNNTHDLPEDLSEEKLMKMCLDIAEGMEYLAEKRFIHRDLAARNCMVDKFLSIKIADFGLAKDIYSTEYYRVDKHTTLPVKWMSIESLLDGYFDEKTDVWAYGITCWEIFSLGRIPYPGVDNANVITLLKNGKRLDKPELCPSKMNELITSTWLEDPDDRPSFSQIVQNLHTICNFTEVVDEEESIKDDEDATESNGYIKVLAE